MTWLYSGGASRPSNQYTATRELIRDDDDDVIEDDDDIVFYQDSSRWRWAAAVAAAVLLVAVLLTVLIVRGGDGTSTMAGITPSGSAPALTPAPTSARRVPAPSTSLSAETVTTVTPSPTTPSPTSVAAPPSAQVVDPRTVTYTITGTRQPGDIVSVTYLDETGFPRTDFNVTLPWSKTIVSGGNVLLNSVTAVSLASHLNCSITDANGQAITSQAYNTIATTCNR